MNAIPFIFMKEKKYVYETTVNETEFFFIYKEK